MKSSIAFSLFFAAIVSLATIGCSNVDLTIQDEVKSEVPKTETRKEKAEAVEVPAAKEGDADIVGDWKLDTDATIKANGTILKTPGINAAIFKRSIRIMVMDFKIKPDSTFECYEKSENIESNYTGVWDVEGNKVGLYQETRDGVKDQDEIEGTVKNDRMDMVHHQAGLTLNIVLVR